MRRPQHDSPSRACRSGSTRQFGPAGGYLREEEIWLASQKSARTRRAYKLDVGHFMRTLGILSPGPAAPGGSPGGDRLGAHHARGARSSRLERLRRRLAALSSLFKHLVRHRAAERNPRDRRDAAGDQTARKAARSLFRKRKRASCSMRPRPTQ